MCARMVGPILEDIATEKCLPVIRGVAAKEHVLHWELISPSIHNQEENVYVQSLHGGEHSWLGLTDIDTEGKFIWSDGTPFNFHYWAKHQPNNFRNEDCVHTLGFLQDHKYEWNDVNCTDCHRFTCKKGNASLDSFKAVRARLIRITLDQHN